jgi:hypothetical protein
LVNCRASPHYQEAAGPQFWDQQIDVAHLGGQAAVPVTVAVAVPLLGALVPVGTDHSGDLQLNELLQTMTRQLGDQLTGSAAIK